MSVSTELVARFKPDADPGSSGPSGDGSAPQPRGIGRARRLDLRGGEVIAAVIVGLVLIAVVAPQVLASHHPNEIDPGVAFRSPSWAHWFGTDESGRDTYSRVVYGTQSSLLIGLLATLVGIGGGLVLGTVAGLGGRGVDFAVGRLLEVLFAVPLLLLALLLVSTFGGGEVASGLAVGVATTPGYARIIRSQVISIRSSGFVEAATVLGRGRPRVVRRHVLPNVIAPLFVLASLGIGQAIVWACSLSFLGLGAKPPTAEWGAMLAAGRTYISNAWWLTFFPGALIVVSAAAVTVLGRSLQRRARER